MASLREQVGHSVRHWRKVNGLSQEQLANLVGKSVETVTKIERGRVAPSFATLEALAEALEIPVQDLFGVGDVPARPGRDDGLVRLIARLSALDPDDIEWVDKLVAVALARKVRTRQLATRPRSS